MYQGIKNLNQSGSCLCLFLSACLAHCLPDMWLTNVSLVPSDWCCSLPQRTWVEAPWWHWRPRTSVVAWRNAYAASRPWETICSVRTKVRISGGQWEKFYHWWTASIKPRLLFSPCKLFFLRTFFFSHISLCVMLLYLSVMNLYFSNSVLLLSHWQVQTIYANFKAVQIYFIVIVVMIIIILMCLFCIEMADLMNTQGKKLKKVKETEKKLSSKKKTRWWEELNQNYKL